MSIVAIISVLSVASCASQRPTAQKKIRTEWETIRDTSIIVEPDCAALHALIDRDSLNRIILRAMDVQTGKRIVPTVSTQSNPDGTLAIDIECHEDSLLLEIELRDRIIEDLTESTQTVEVERPPNRWESFCIVCGYILMVEAALMLIFFLRRFFGR